MWRCSYLAVLIWPSAEVSCPDRLTQFGYVSACSDVGDAITMGESWTNSLVSHRGMARVQSSMPQFPLMPAECLGTCSGKLSLCCG